MKRIVFITPHDAEYGFSLAGMTQYVTDPAGAEAILRRIFAQPDTGVVVIDERLLENIPEERFREMEERWYGILLTLPAPAKIGGGEVDTLQRLIQRVLGYHVRLQP